MARKTYSLAVTADRCVRVKVGRYFESFGIDDKSRAKLIDCIWWALRTAGVPGVTHEQIDSDLSDMGE